MDWSETEKTADKYCFFRTVVNGEELLRNLMIIFSIYFKKY